MRRFAVIGIFAFAVVSLIRCSTPRPSYYQDDDQAYPNPYSPPTATISYVVDDSCHVVMVLYDVRGQLVDTLVNAVQLPGNYKTQISSDKHLSSGVYIYKLTVCDYTAMKKVMLLK